MATRQQADEAEVEVVEVVADFTGIAAAEDGGAQPPVSISDIVAGFSTELTDYLAKQQQRINELEYELSRTR